MDGPNAATFTRSIMKKHPPNSRSRIMVDTPDASAVPPETVHVVSDAASGLEGVIVLHSTRRGPAAGGCRFWRYANRAAMTADALRLAEGMAYKNALADLPLGGGKAVLNVPDGAFDRRRLFA